MKFGIIGCGKIAERFLHGCKQCEDVEVVGAASRDIGKAESFCGRNGIRHAYGAYEALCADDRIDAVYIATPPFTHYALVTMALNNGKHVLCEKPFVAGESEVGELFALARSKGLLLMEAMKAVFTPTTVQVKRWLDEKRIGTLIYAEAGYGYDAPFSHDHWVYETDRMGGSMLDVGVYAIAYLNHMVASDVEASTSLITRGETGCDEFIQILVRFENGVQASVRSALNVTLKNSAYFYGSEGYIEVGDFWKTRHASLIRHDGNNESFDAKFNSEFAFEIEHFVDCIKKGTPQSPVMGENASLAIIRLINKHL